MDSVGAGAQGGIDDDLGVEVMMPVAEGHGFISMAHVQGQLVDVGVNRHAGQAHLTAGAQDADGNFPSISTVEGVHPGANWYEREVYDMFGVKFDGHSDMRRILMPADWQGHPLRKDYPLGYEEVAFSFNVDEIMKRKPHPKE